MATFTAFSNILPDPTRLTTDAGDISSSGAPGPGFAALNFQSITNTQVSRTISGRGIQRDGGSQHWEFTISYNPMFRYQFEPVSSFLLMRNPRRDPFYVVLPQYSRPRDTVFANWADTNIVMSRKSTAGDSTLMLYSGEIVFGGGGNPKPGDAFTIQDPSDFNHQKVYLVGAVETNTYYQAGTTAPGINEVRIHITPPLQRSATAGSIISFINPKFRVITKSDTQDYSLNTDNLYSFSLACEEIQP